MADFSSIQDLAKYLGSSQFLSNQEMERILVQEAERLEGYLKEEINNYYKSYTPKVYVRTYDWINSIRVSKPELNGSVMSIRIYFDDSMAYHPSVLDGEDGYVPWLYENGFRTRLDSVKSIFRFTNFEGTHYVSNAVAKYNSENPYNFKVTVETGYASYDKSYL